MVKVGPLITLLNILYHGCSSFSGISFPKLPSVNRIVGHKKQYTIYTYKVFTIYPRVDLNIFYERSSSSSAITFPKLVISNCGRIFGSTEKQKSTNID